MYTNEYEEALDRVKTAKELSRDYSIQQYCYQNLRQYDRFTALQCLQNVIREYYSQIEIIGQTENVMMCSGIPQEQISDDVLKIQLQYIARRIPVYVLVREGKHELGKQICRWLEERYK